MIIVFVDDDNENSEQEIIREEQIANNKKTINAIKRLENMKKFTAITPRRLNNNNNDIDSDNSDNNNIDSDNSDNNNIDSDNSINNDSDDSKETLPEMVIEDNLRGWTPSIKMSKNMKTVTIRDPLVIVIGNDTEFPVKQDLQAFYYLWKETLCYETRIWKNLTSEEIKDVVYKLSEPQEDYDGLIFCYSGHGKENSLCGCNCKTIEIEDIIKSFCRSAKFSGKPKIFIFDCCREGINEDMTKVVDKEDKVFLIFASISNNTASTSNSGSYFTQVFVSFISKKYQTQSLDKMMSMINYNVESVSQNNTRPYFRSIPRLHVYFKKHV